MSDLTYCGLALCGAVVAMGAFAGCGRTASRTYVSAKLVLYDPPEHVSDTKVINDVASIDRLIGYLTGLQDRKHSNIAGHWTPEMELTLIGTDGAARSIAIGGRFAYWRNVGTALGDRPVREGFEAYVRGLLDEQRYGNKGG
jgi:hypothetical protein